MAFDLVVSRLEMEWVRGVGRGECSLSIRKHYGDGTVVQLYLTEAESTYMSQLITTGKDKSLCAMSTPSFEDTAAKHSSMEPPSYATPLERSDSSSQ